LITARIAARRLRYVFTGGGLTPCAARNSAGLISATVAVDTRAGGRISPFGYAAQNELIGHVGRLELPVDPDGQTFVGELIDEIEHPIIPPLVRAILDEVIGPDMVGPLAAQPDAGSVRKPDATLLGLFGGDL
jgi:hypothetical protein